MSMNVEHFCCTVTVNTLNNGHFNTCWRLKPDILDCWREHPNVAYTEHMEIIKSAQICYMFIRETLWSSSFIVGFHSCRPHKQLTTQWPSVSLKRNSVLSLRSVFFALIIHLTGDRKSCDKSFWWIHWHSCCFRSLKVSVVPQESKDLNNRLL